MARENIDTEPVPDTLEGIQKYLARMRADFDSHNHDGANSKGFQTMKSETLTSRTIAMRKTSYASSTAGFWVGLVGATVKFDLGDGTNYLRWDGAALTITAAITGGSITGATITGGTFRTATSGQRIEITASDNLIHIYDASAEVVSIGTALASAIRITLNSNNTDGIKITSTTDATLGIRMDSSSNVTFNALRIALTNSGSGNDGYGLYVENGGGASTSYCIHVSKTGVGDAIHVSNTGTGDALDINNSGSTYRAMVVDCNTASANGHAIDLLNTGASTTVYITAAGDRGNTAGVYIDDGGSGDVLGIYQTVNSSLSSIGIHMNISNAGSGTEYAFRFEGAEIVSSAVGGSQDKKVRILVGATLYYIPCYTA